ncbi:MAG: lasso RiPP family leader peptide-containing protein [Armatimonadota bacterium]
MRTVRKEYQKPTLRKVGQLKDVTRGTQTPFPL